jgi:hypothetical protein
LGRMSNVCLVHCWIETAYMGRCPRIKPGQADYENVRANRSRKWAVLTRAKAEGAAPALALRCGAPRVRWQWVVVLQRRQKPSDGQMFQIVYLSTMLGPRILWPLAMSNGRNAFEVRVCSLVVARGAQISTITFRARHNTKPAAGRE